MRIRDWSSDVCSSDLAFVEGVDAVQFVDREGRRATLLHPRQDGHLRRSHRLGEGVPVGFDCLGIVWKGGGQILEGCFERALNRSAERRVVNVSVITCRSRW